MAWLAHLYTALGAVLALASTIAVFEARFRDVFVLLSAAIFIDSTDGWLARALRVKERVPGYDGARLDDIVDYLTYVFVPVLLVIYAGLLPAGWDLAVGSLVLLASAYGFGQAEAKVSTTDYFFTGFPSYWNIVAFYLYALSWPTAANAAVVVAFAVLIFVPIRYVYPSRTPALRSLTVGLGLAWGAAVLLALYQLLRDGVASEPLVLGSLLFPIYYGGLSLVLTGQRVSR
jgi:phosphatidylcholine synthase